MPASASGQARQAFHPVVTAPAVETQRNAVLDDLEAVAAELGLMQPGIASRDGLGLSWGCRDGRTSERTRTTFSVFDANTAT
jgi:hypothetical protein